MAVPVLRGCSRVPACFIFSRLLVKGPVMLSRSAVTRLPSVRLCSSRPGAQRQRRAVVVMSIPNPLHWIRTNIYYFLIKTYFDQEFTIEEFTKGAKQAFSLVSRLLSQCQFDAMEGLVANDLIAKLEEKCNLLPLSHRKALFADSDDIVYTAAGDVGIYYDDKGRKFVSILMHFWYMTSTQLPDVNMEATRLFQVNIGKEKEGEAKKMLAAKYEFQREFTQGVVPDWTITRIEHTKILN